MTKLGIVAAALLASPAALGNTPLASRIATLVASRGVGGTCFNTRQYQVGDRGDGNGPVILTWTIAACGPLPTIAQSFMPAEVDNLNQGQPQ